MTDAQCGWPTSDGHGCRNPPTGDDGRCWIDGHGKAGPGGRPSKFNEDRKAAILDAAESGTTVEGCARAAGIGVSTLYDWLDQYPEFSESFNRARARGEAELVREVVKRDPKFILERSYDYVKTERHEVGLDADHSFDATEGVTAEFVTYEPDAEE